MGTKIYIIMSALFVLITGGGSFLVNKNLGANTQVSALPTVTSVDDSDEMIINVNSGGTFTTKKITVSNATSSLQTWYNGVYQTLLVNSAGLRSALSDETGSGGAAVFATGPTISGAQLTGTPTLTDPVLNGTITGTGVVGIAQGGTGSTTKTSALNALLPSQVGQSGKFAQSDGTNLQWGSYSFPTSNPTASTSALVSDTSGNIIWDIPTWVWASSTTNVIGTSTATENSISSAGYTLTRQMWVRGPGVVRVNFGCKDVNGAFQYFCKVYVNGVAKGTEHTGNSNAYVNYSDDIYLSGDDNYVQIYSHGPGGTNTYVGTFYITAQKINATSTTVSQL